ncbi:glycosyltransferase family 2 protein [Hydrogenimonas urashimensis]|uniref:glycosyltransferase family 2 protein n=1 Tax=Hydrogenimonas urashimensis TaxID=2740515 RepID=UPI001915502B|nr:glycosyltransferase family A protein [Hydrogenimonas urashimensis]
MPAETPLVSVIIPTYNAARHLPDAIESILRQEYPNLEIIVVDDGSTDNTEEVLQPYRDLISYHRKENGGPASARNYGLRLARGEFIAFLDADDIWPDDKLARQLAHFRKHPDALIVLGRQRVDYLPDARELAYGDDLVTEPQICQSMPVALVRREAFDKIGLFDEELIYYEDWDWHLRAREKELKILAYDEVTNIHRRHDANMTHDMRRMSKYAFQMFRKSLKRRRENPNIKAKLPSYSDLEGKSEHA